MRNASAEWVAAAHNKLRAPKPTKRELYALWQRQRGRCALTGVPVDKPHLDHIVPTAAGGNDVIDNLQWVHPTANHAKNSRSVEEFRAWLLAAADALRRKIELESLL